MKTRRLAAFAASALSLAMACSSPSDADADAPSSAAVVQGDVEYRATTAILESFPVQLKTSVVMANRSRSRVVLQLASGCPVQLRVYHDQERQRLVWDQGRVIACTKEIQIVELAAGDTAQRSAPIVSARAILGDSLPDGRYWLGAYVQVVGAPLVVPAGVAELSVPRE